MNAAHDAAGITDLIVSLLKKRVATSSICPSEVARGIASDNELNWRPLMALVRDVAAELARHGVITITRSGERLDPSELQGGPIRLRRGPQFPD